MKKAVRKRLWLVLLGMLAGESSAGKVLYSNDFSMGKADINWRSEVGLEVSVVDDSAGIGGGNALQISCKTGLRETGIKFTETTLSSPGDYIEFSYDIRCPSLADRLNISFLNDISNDSRLNFAEADFFGFTLQGRGAENSGLYQYISANVIGTIKGFPFKTFSALRTGWGSGPHSQKVCFARIDDKTVRATVTMDGKVVVNWDINSADHFTYDCFGLRPIVVGDVVLLDNLVITAGTVLG